MAKDIRNNATLAYYSNNATKIASKYESTKMSEVQKILIEYLAGCQSILEIGCGSGRDADFMAANGFSVIGIDGCLEMVNEAEQYHPKLKGKLIHHALPSKLPFEDKSFDGVYSIAMFMHIQPTELDQVFSDIARVLKPNGIFIFSVSLSRPGLDENGMDNEGRFFATLSSEDWLSYCTNNGFKIIDTHINEDSFNRSDIKWFTGIVRRNG